ncbi:MAG: ABC transporter ATP-binding protein, partial [Bacteroidales bacterium]
PKLLLLDEATSALDSFTEATIMDSLVLLKNDVTIIFVTHRLNLIKYFDKVITLDSKTDTI